jgi:hypothetical protein
MNTLWPNGLMASDHFRVDDFACHDPHATPYPVEKVESVLMPFCRGTLETIRHYVCGDKYILILSGGRTPEWNAREGGAADSRHLFEHGDATDFWCPPLGLTAGPALYLAILTLHRAGLLPNLGGLGKYGNRCHVDDRPHEPGVLVTWDNTNNGARG